MKYFAKHLYSFLSEILKKKKKKKKYFYYYNIIYFYYIFFIYFIYISIYLFVLYFFKRMTFKSCFDRNMISLSAILFFQFMFRTF